MVYYLLELEILTAILVVSAAVFTVAASLIIALYLVTTRASIKKLRFRRQSNL